VVRNVPFEATRKELRELLSAFGELTSIRLPKKFDGKHRGFAFADFVTASISQKRKLKNLHSSFTRKIRNLYSSYM
jgi:multiple RNA-binding domain-containing protein 1